MRQDFSRQFFLLIVLLSITPFILFLGKNFLLTEFFTAKYFWLAIIYSLSFIFFSVCANYLSKKILFFILFFAYLSFLQFYFFDIQQFLKIYKDGSTRYYVLFFIVFISFIATLSSKSSIFRNFVFILLFLNIVISVYNLIPATERYFQTFFKTTNIIDNSSNTKNFKPVKYPNIFYIVPDGLASPKILKNYANIDYKDSIKRFEEKGFNIPKHNYSSYNATYLSLAALFKMDYPVTDKSPAYKNRSNFYPSIREKNPELLQYLNANNYEFIIVPPLWGGGCPKSREYKCLTPETNSYYENFFQDYAVKTFFQNSLISRILGRYLPYKNKNKMDDAAKTVLDKIKTNPEIWSEGGVFTMMHMFMPHTPYREENCSITDRYLAPSKEGYKSSVYCTFNRIHELSDIIIKNYPKASIVVQSDHGLDPKIYPKNKKFVEFSNSLIDHRLAAFTAVRGCKSDQAAKLNQVNIVKYIIECLVSGIPTKQFENKSYFGFYESTPEFGKVFRVRQNK